MMATPEREEQAFIAPTTTLTESAMRHRGWVPSALLSAMAEERDAARSALALVNEAPADPEFARVARAVRAVTSWTPEARAHLVREMRERWPDTEPLDTRVKRQLSEADARARHERRERAEAREMELDQGRLRIIREYATEGDHGEADVVLAVVRRLDAATRSVAEERDVARTELSTIRAICEAHGVTRRRPNGEPWTLAEVVRASLESWQGASEEAEIAQTELARERWPGVVRRSLDVARDAPRGAVDGLTVEELQRDQPWLIPYSPGVVLAEKELIPHILGTHAVLHAMKSLGKIAAVLEKLDHRGGNISDPERGMVAAMAADLFTIAMRFANLYGFSLVSELRRRVLEKNDVDVAPAVLDAPAGPLCSCGQPSRYESGWCGECSEPLPKKR